MTTPVQEQISTDRALAVSVSPVRFPVSADMMISGAKNSTAHKAPRLRPARRRIRPHKSPAVNAPAASAAKDRKPADDGGIPSAYITPAAAAESTALTAKPHITGSIYDAASLIAALFFFLTDKAVTPGQLYDAADGSIPAGQIYAKQLQILDKPYILMYNTLYIAIYSVEDIMKFYRWNKHYLGWGITAFVVIIASMLVFTMLQNMGNIGNGIGSFLGVITPIIYGFIIAYLLAPVVEKLEKGLFGRIFKKSGEHYEDKNEESGDAKYGHLKVYVKNKPARICSITVTFLAFIGIIAGVLIAIVPQLTATISLLVDNIPTYITNMTNWVADTFQNYPEIGNELNDILRDAGSTLKSFLNTSILPQMGDYLGFLTNGIMSVVGTILNLIFGIVVAIYCLYSKELFAAQAKKSIYCLVPIKNANRFIGSVRKIHRSFGNFITGTIIDSFVVGCITFAVTTLSGVPFSLLVSVIMGITNIIPYFGPFIGLVPCLFLIFMEDPFMCIIFTVIVLVIQNVNGNIISPRILGESTGLTSFWVIFAILVGQGIFGFWGLIIGIPLFAVVYSTAKTFISDKLKTKGLPHHSDDYTDINSFDIDEQTGAALPVSLSETVAAEREAREKREAAAKEKRKAENAAKKKRIQEGIDHIRGSVTRSGKKK